MIIGKHHNIINRTLFGTRFRSRLDDPSAVQFQDRPMKIDQEQLERIETLARLQLTEDEEDRLRDQLSQILEHVEKIGELDLQDVEPLTHPLDLSNVMRADEREDPLNAKEVLRNAPERTGQFFKVPQIIDNENG